MKTIADLWATLDDLDPEDWVLTAHPRQGKRLGRASVATWDPAARKLIDEDSGEPIVGPYKLSLRPRDRSRDNRRRLAEELGDRGKVYWVDVPEGAVARSNSAKRRTEPPRRAAAVVTDEETSPAEDEPADARAAREAVARADRARAEADALQAEQHLERVRAASANPMRELLDTVRQVQAPRPPDPVGSIVGALTPIVGQLVAAWQSASAKAEERMARQQERMDTLLTTFLKPPPPPAGGESKDVPGMMSQLKTLRDLFQFARELTPGGGDDDSGPLGDTGKLIDLVRAFVDRGPQQPAAVPAPRPRPSAVASHAELLARRVAAFAEAVLIELQNGSDAEAVADQLYDAFGLLPLALRQAIESGELTKIREQLSASIGPEACEAWMLAVAQKPGGVEWVTEFCTALLDEQDDEQEDDDSSAADATVG